MLTVFKFRKNSLNNMLSDSSEKLCKLTWEDNQKILQKSNKSMKLSKIFGGFRGLNHLPYHTWANIFVTYGLFWTSFISFPMQKAQLNVIFFQYIMSFQSKFDQPFCAVKCLRDLHTIYLPPYVSNMLRDELL